MDYGMLKRVELQGEIHLYYDRALVTLCHQDKTWHRRVSDGEPVTCVACRVRVQGMLRDEMYEMEKSLDRFLNSNYTKAA